MRLPARRTCCCGRRSSTPARASSRRWRRRCAGHAVLVGFPEATAAGATTRSRCCATGASPRPTASSGCPTTRCSTRSATSSRRRALRRRRRRHWRSASSICEDCWFPGPARQARAAGAQLIVVANGSPYHTRQHALRRAQVGARARETGLPVVYVNRVGGQDELVFDGASFVADAARRRHAAAAGLARGGRAGDARRWRSPKPVRGALDPDLEPHVYDALVMGVRDYVGKNRFPGVLLGLSGGVDSALTLAVAVDALGPDRVRAVMLPSHYNARDQPRGRAGDGGHRRRALRRDLDRADVRRVPRRAGRRVRGPSAPTRPRRTSRRASAARC